VSAASVESGPSNAGARGSVRLLGPEPDLASGLSDVERASAARLLVRALHVAPGLWSPPAALRDAMGMLVVGGQLTRFGRTFARRDVQLLGPGDVAECRVLSGSDGEWRALVWVQLAVPHGVGAVADDRGVPTVAPGSPEPVACLQVEAQRACRRAALRHRAPPCCRRGRLARLARRRDRPRSRSRAPLVRVAS
jgi:hypothetical protein